MPTRAAAQLAERRGPSSAAIADQEILLVAVASRRFGLLARDVAEVQRMVAYEPLPGAPAAVEGVIDLRGTVVPVLDLAERLGLPTHPPQVSDHLVITRSRRHVVAIRVDEALRIEVVPAARVTASEAVGPHAERVSGVVRLSESLLVVADLDAFLAWHEERALTGALAGRSEQAADG